MPTLLQLAFFCGLFPLAMGTVVFLLWLVFRSDLFMALGAMTLSAGLAAFALGGISLLAHIVKHRGARSMRPALFAGILLFANFPVAATYTFIFIHLESRYEVTFENRSHKTVRACRVDGGGITVDFGSVASGKSISRTMHFRSDGQLELVFRQGDKETKEIIEGYVTNGMGGNKHVTLEADEQLVIR